ncbi:ANTAR domain-containing response regulator [Microbacteriaceae bacterium 4G12]
MNKTIVMVDDEPITRMDICELLAEAGYNVVGEASDGFEAIDVCKKHKPDLVLMDIKMPILDGIKASKVIMKEKLAGGTILLSAFNDKEYVEKAKDIGVLGYLVKPLDEKSLIPTIEVCLAKANEVNVLKAQYEKVTKKLEERKLIDIAKGLIMEERSISESEAYSFLRKLSMDRRCSMGEIATTIMTMYE